jgi:hypothetical protein
MVQRWCGSRREVKTKKKLWTAADDMWVHDKFELLDLDPFQDPEDSLVSLTDRCAGRLND